jgi:anaphase-promoting complex subunit 1
MLSQEAAVGSPRPAWMMNSGWLWLNEIESVAPQASPKGFDLQEIILGGASNEDKFLPRHIKLSRNFVSSNIGQAAFGVNGYMPTAEDKSIERRQKCLADLVVGLHLLHEEQKLDIASVDALDTGNASLNPVLGQMFRWLGWRKWVALYDVENVSMEDIGFDSCMPLTSLLTWRLLTLLSAVLFDTPQPFDPPGVYEWIETCLITRNLVPFVTLGDIVASRSGAAFSIERWSSMPRTALFMRFFAKIKPESTTIDIVEALFSSGITAQVLDTLPEAIIVPLREAIVGCQAQPPVSWGKDLLSLVDREDVNMLLFPGQRKRLGYSSLLVRILTFLEVSTNVIL